MSLLKSNIESSLSALSGRNLLEFDPDGFRRAPLFLKGDGLKCLQPDFLGFYSLPEIVGGTLRAINFTISATHALENKLYGPSVIMSYSGAYQLLGAYLSLRGHLWIERPEVCTKDTLPTVREEGATEGKKPFAAVLDVDGKWGIALREYGHTHKWLELEGIFRRENFVIPLSFIRLFEFLYQRKQKSNAYFESAELFEEYMRNPKPYMYEIWEVIPEFLRMIPDIRHDAVYRGFGADPEIWDALINRDHFNTNDLANRARALTEFVNAFLAEVSLEAEELLQSLSLDDRLMAALAYRVAYPVLDRPRIDLIGESMSREACRTVASIVYEGI